MYTWTTALGVLPPTALYVYLGTMAASLKEILGDAFETPETAEPDDIPTSPTAPFAPTPFAPVEAPTAMDVTRYWVLGIGVVVTVAVAVLVTIFTSRALKKASRMGGVGSLETSMLDASSGDVDDEGSEDNTSIQMKDLSGLPLNDSVDNTDNNVVHLTESRVDLLEDDNSDDVESGRSSNPSLPVDTFQFKQSPALSRLSTNT